MPSGDPATATAAAFLLLPKAEGNCQTLHRLHWCWCGQLVATHSASEQRMSTLSAFAEEKKKKKAKPPKNHILHPLI